jgi:cytosine/adenosine deaminase-related metal-dependent hydrolase
MSDASRRESDRVSSLWQDALTAIRSGEKVRLTARWIFPVSSPPIENGLLEIADGRIESVEPLAGRSCLDAIDVGNSAILPSLVNAHAHLEFSDLAEPIQPPAPFADWIQNLIAHRNARSESMTSLVARGARQSAESGTSIVGDIVTGLWLPDESTRAGSKIVAFRELIGLRPEEQKPQLQLARHHIAVCRDSGVQPALSPHASFSVSPELFRSLVQLAAEKVVPLCIHLAETKAELELLESGTGELVEMLKRFGIWNSDLIARGTRPLDFLKQLADLPAASIAHGNYLSDEEGHFLARHPNITTIYCPRTHRFFGHGAHPWQRLLAAGASIALGTDGRSSNPDYSLWAEIQFLDRETHGSARPELLQMATLNGAEALGLGEFGTLEAGHQTMPSLVPFGENRTTDPWSALSHSAPFPSLVRSGT